MVQPPQPTQHHPSTHTRPLPLPPPSPHHYHQPHCLKPTAPISMSLCPGQCKCCNNGGQIGSVVVNNGAKLVQIGFGLGEWGVGGQPQQCQFDRIDQYRHLLRVADTSYGTMTILDQVSRWDGCSQNHFHIVQIAKMNELHE